MFTLLFAFSMEKTYERKMTDQRKTFISKQVTILINNLNSGGYFTSGSNMNMENQISQLASAFDGRIQVLNAQYRVLTDTFQINQGKYLLDEKAVRAMTGILSDSENGSVDNGYIESYIPVYPYDPESVVSANDPADHTVTDSTRRTPIGLVLVYSSMSDVNSITAYAKRQSITLLLLFMLIILVVAVSFTVVLTRYFGVFTKEVEKVAEGETDSTVELHGFTEMENLADAFNRAVGKLDKLEKSRQEFVSNVSHELKTPITSMKVLADSILSSDQEVEPEVYRDFLNDIAQEVDRENQIITDLLSLVRMGRSANDALKVTTVNINELIELLLKRLRPLAAQRNIEIVYESFRQVNAEIDEVKLTLAFSNLIENAIKYNRDDGWIRVTLNADHRYFYLKVADSGVGIPEDCQEHVFERFYRVDKARSRDTGGTGLGLAITHTAVTMHHGTIKLYSKPGEGTTFTVRIPLHYTVTVAASKSGSRQSLFSGHSRDKDLHAGAQGKTEHKTEKTIEKKTVKDSGEERIRAGIEADNTDSAAVPQQVQSDGERKRSVSVSRMKLRLRRFKEALEGREKKPEAEQGPSASAVEPDPVPGAEPDVVVLDTDKMDKPEVVRIRSGEKDTGVKEDLQDVTAMDQLTGTQSDAVEQEEAAGLKGGDSHE